MLDIYFENEEVWLMALLGVAALTLLLLYWLRLRPFRLINKYASWQAEAQAVEQATHEALITGLDQSKIFVSLIVPVNEHNSSQAEELLKQLFCQEADAQFEVILAEEGQSEEVKDVYKRNKDNYAQLRYTFVPNSSRYIERRKLAITLGIKASRGEWSIVVTPETHPANNQWLHHYVQNLSEDLNWVEAYYNYEDDGSCMARRAIMDGVSDWMKRLCAYEGECILGCDSSNWAVRNKWFITQNGFADSLNIILGEEAIFANRHATSEQTLLLCSPSTKLIEDLPSSKELMMHRIYKSEIAQHLNKSARKYYCRESIATFLLYLYLLSMFLYVVSRVGVDVVISAYRIQWIYIDIVALILTIIGGGLPWYFIIKAMTTLNEKKHGVYLYFYYLLRPFHTLSTETERWLHKQEFTRKYI